MQRILLILACILLLALGLDLTACKSRRGSSLSGMDMKNPDLCDPEIYDILLRTYFSDVLTKLTNEEGLTDQTRLAEHRRNCYNDLLNIMNFQPFPLPESTVAGLQQAINQEFVSGLYDLQQQVAAQALLFIDSVQKGYQNRLRNYQTRKRAQSYLDAFLKVEKLVDFANLLQSADSDRSIEEIITDASTELINEIRALIPEEPILEPLAKALIMVVRSQRLTYRFNSVYINDETRIPRIFPNQAATVNALKSEYQSIIRETETNYIKAFSPGELHPQLLTMLNITIGNELIVDPTTHSPVKDNPNQTTLPSEAETISTQNKAASLILLQHMNNVANAAYLERLNNKGPDSWLDTLRAQTVVYNREKARFKPSYTEPAVVNNSDYPFRPNAVSPITNFGAGYFSPLLAWYTIAKFSQQEMFLYWRDIWAQNASYYSNDAKREANATPFPLFTVEDITKATQGLVNIVTNRKDELVKNLGIVGAEDLVRYERELSSIYNDFESLAKIENVIARSTLDQLTATQEFNNRSYLAMVRRTDRSEVREGEEITGAIDAYVEAMNESVAESILLLCMQAAIQGNPSEYISQYGRSRLLGSRLLGDKECALPFDQFLREFDGMGQAASSVQSKFSYLCGYDQPASNRSLSLIRKRTAKLQTSIALNQICRDKTIQMGTTLMQQVPYLLLMPVAMGAGGQIAKWGVDSLGKWFGLFNAVATQGARTSLGASASHFVAHTVASAFVLDVGFSALLQPLGMGMIWDFNKDMQTNLIDIARRVGLSSVNFAGIAAIGPLSTGLTLKMAMKPSWVRYIKLPSHLLLETAYFTGAHEIMGHINHHYLFGDEMPHMEGENIWTKIAHSLATAAIFRYHSARTHNKQYEGEIKNLQEQVLYKKSLYRGMHTPAGYASHVRTKWELAEDGRTWYVDGYTPRDAKNMGTHLYAIDPYILLGYKFGPASSPNLNSISAKAARQQQKWRDFGNKHPEMKDLAENMTQRIEVARRMLSNPEKRALYDEIWFKQGPEGIFKDKFMRQTSDPLYKALAL